MESELHEYTHHEAHPSSPHKVTHTSIDNPAIIISNEAIGSYGGELAVSRRLEKFLK